MGLVSQGKAVSRAGIESTMAALFVHGAVVVKRPVNAPTQERKKVPPRDATRPSETSV